MKPALRVLPLLLLAAHLPAAASDLAAFAWLMKPEGTAEVGEENVLGTRFDLGADLGADDEIVVPGGVIRLGNASAFGLDYMQMSAEGDNSITRNIRFKDLEFTTNSRVLSEVEASFLHAYLRLGVPATGFSIGGEAGGVYTDFSARAAASGIGSASADAEAILPYAGGHISLEPVKGFSIKGQVRYSSWDIDDKDVTYLDWEATARIEVTPFFLGGGYRSMDVEFSDKGDNIVVDIGFSGPVIYAGLTW